MRELRRWSVILLLLPLTLLAVLVVRILRPLVLIRFRPFSSEVIGILAACTEMYLCRRNDKRTLDVFYSNRKPCNQQLEIMWDRILHTWSFAKQVDALNRALPGGKSHLIPDEYFEDRDIEGLLPRTPIHLSFTPEEERFGQERLKNMGIQAPFICFHSRDSTYHQVMHPECNPHTYSQRDSSIQNYIPVADEMTHRGYYAIRMGAIVKEPLQTTNPMIIDYATNYWSDFMDIYLCANCYFYIGDDCGLNRVPLIFRVPLANLNVIPIDHVHTQGWRDLFILKKLWLCEEGRFLKFREIFDRGANGFVRMEQYEQAGIEPVENTAEEITALAVEMDERLKGKWQTTEEDKKLQECFWQLFRPTTVKHGLIESRIGAEFLRQNKELLE